MKFNEFNNPANPDEPHGYIYQQWKYFKKKMGRYCLIPNEIIQYLPLLSGPELNLYLFYAINADNNYGNSFYSIVTLANCLNVSTKTINNWNTKLQNLGLIKREVFANGNSSVTQLLPLTNFILRPTNRDLARSKNQLEKAGYKATNKLHLAIFHKNNKLTKLKFTIYYRQGPSTLKDTFAKNDKKLASRDTSSKNEGPKWLIGALQDPNNELSETDNNIIASGKIPWVNHETGQIAWVDHNSYLTIFIKNNVENENDDAKLLETLYSFATEKQLTTFKWSYRQCKIRLAK